MAKLYIKNMVCHRCKLVLKNELEALHLHPLHIELGEVELQEELLTEAQTQALSERLSALGFELMDDRKAKLIEKIKTSIIDLIHHSSENTVLKTSEYLKEQLNYDYTYLSNLFSEVEGTTIEHYLILQKTEKVKELLVYNELSLSEIAHRLGYSSAAHLSTQFKKVTGLTPSHFRSLRDPSRRQSLDKI